MNQIRCISCGQLHKATSDKFSIARKENRYIEAEKTIRPVIVGYLCWLCVRKHVHREERKRAIIAKNARNKQKTQEENRSNMESESIIASQNIASKTPNILHRTWAAIQKRIKI